MGLVGNRTSAWRESVLWRWFRRRLDEMASQKSRGLHPVLSSFCPLAPVLSSSCAQVGTLCQGQFKFHLLQGALSDCANQNSLSFELLTLLNVIKVNVHFMGSSVRDEFFKGKKHIHFIPIISLCFSLPIGSA